ncbi:MAG: CDP-glycerol glycerophosphotransferase family protein [Oscillospiraceae bacterium]|nr:CDP-glycerol glycerophosphotransferase family protein [Oscillospiraceae bacterium]
MKKKISVFVGKLCKKSVFIRTCVKKLRLLYRKAVYFFGYYLKYRVDDKIILFESFKGAFFCDSPKAIYEEMLKDERFKDCTLVCVTSSNSKKLKSSLSTSVGEATKADNSIFVRYNSREYLRYYASAKYIVTNSIYPILVIKKKKQVYVQTWHGTPFKRIGCDIVVDHENPYNTVAEIHKKYENEAKIIDYMLSPSAYTTDKLISSFHLNKLGKENSVLELGYPRNDFLYNYTEEMVEKIKSDLGIPAGKKVILYAPTFRDNSHTTGIGYTYFPDTDFDYLRQELEDDFVILYRAHYFINDTFDFEKYAGFIFNVSTIPDINTLYVVSDLLVTDYSSVFFDYANLKRPILFYMYDFDNYRNKLRGFYMEPEELPGPISGTEQQLAGDIKRLAESGYDYGSFNERFTYLDDGQASRRVIDAIFQK